MYKHIIEQAGNINWMAVFALVTFCFIFGMSLILVFKQNKQFTDHMANLPLEDSSLTVKNATTHEE
jgi:hypothetical protein